MCPSCHSPNVVSHPELLNLSIAHLDCDAFYAAVEKRDNPELRDKPVIIGGGQRGVVSTACYIARMSGVKSAMPMFKARRLCPQAVIIKPRMAHYKDVGRQVREKMLSVTPQIEPISIDEAFLDLSGTERLHKAPSAVTLSRLQNEIRQEIGITVSIGLSFIKYLAKVSSDFDKPNGFFVVGKADAKTFLAQQPTSLLWGVGKAFGRKLARDGVTHIGQIQQMDEAQLRSRYGSMGSHIWHLSNAQDPRRVKSRGRAKSISSERTFSNDISDEEALSDLLWTLCQEVSESLQAKGLRAKTVHLKLKTPEFKLITRSETPDLSMARVRDIFAPARALLAKTALGQPYRLLGVGVSNFETAASGEAAGDLFDDPRAEKSHRLDDVLSDLQTRYGRGSIDTGRGTRARLAKLNRRQSVSTSQTLDEKDS